ncbi:MAG TPA: phosphoribosylglycinamide formyltransferase [Campylobacterales bacterium]|nr:phosphoribosylglycinamide formyltransferase [Campylobacterales bacterium]
MKRVAILFSGAGSNLAYILEHLHQKQLEVVVALTNNPRAEGIVHAECHNVPVEIIDAKGFETREAFDAVVVEKLKAYRPDLTVLAGFMRILTPTFTESIRSINLHPSLLPRHKGLQAIERSYADEHETGGVSVHWVTSELDGGEVILQKEVTKAGKSFNEYNDEVRRIEKIALCEGILKVISALTSSP